MRYDVGEITKLLQDRFRLFDGAPGTQPKSNLATPRNLAVLVDDLSSLTLAIEQKRSEMSDWLPDAGVVLWDKDFAQWKERLAGYEQAVHAAAPDDRAALLWTVTAPLLLGFFGGEYSKLPRRPIDAVTPFVLANELGEADEWRAERFRLFVEDLNPINLVEKIPAWVWIAAVGTIAFMTLRAIADIHRGRR